MKLSDAIAGLAILCAGLAVAALARTFPAIPGQRIGPSVFPLAVGLALALLGAALAIGGRKQPGPAIELDPWVRRPRQAAGFSLVVLVLLLYALVVDRAGFFLTAIGFLSVLMAAFGVRRRWIAPLAVSVTLAIHYVFYTLLRVPLPWGLLEPIAW